MDEIRIGQTLKRLLSQKGLTLKQVSFETGIPYSTLYTWSLNRHPKDLLKVGRLARYLGVNIQELLFGEPLNSSSATGGDRHLGLAQGSREIEGRFEVVIRRIGP